MTINIIVPILLLFQIEIFIYYSDLPSLLTIVISDRDLYIPHFISLCSTCSNLPCLLTIVMLDGDWFLDYDENMHEFMIQTI